MAFHVVHRAEAGLRPGASSSRPRGPASERAPVDPRGKPIRVALCRLSWYVSPETGWKG